MLNFTESDFLKFYDYNLNVQLGPSPVDNPPCAEVSEEEVEKVETATAKLKEWCKEVKKQNQQKSQIIQQQIREEEARHQ
ncbi:hypothetical protein P344_03160 [Spiroplasma mirum ATCC 29335]|uniref:Uncharacterized protein n=1 Tax=Spiroplasma mirum ATCC 29335 TaxID=838561 RepID=W6ALS0_9MOLU|nr:hypothetical protein P344_03160 [Spiroplasma mirum ATCC 29335]